MRRSCGFTLTELLVVVAVIGLLLALGLPAVVRSRSKAKTPVCMGNQRSLSQALAMYVGENRDRLPPNAELPFPEVSCTNWVAGHMGASDLGAEARLMRSPSRSLLRRYMPADEPYACAARNLSKPRTLGLSSRINPTPVVLSNMWQWTPTQEPAFRAMGDLRNPDRTFTFIEESASAVGDAYFAVDHSGTGEPYATAASPTAFFADIPGASHSGATVLSFADGHTEQHLWRSPELRQDRLPSRSRPAGAEMDIAWLREVSLGVR